MCSEQWLGVPPPPVLPAGLSSSCQELACLQVDLLVALYRVELALGVQQLRGRAATSTARLQASIGRLKDISDVSMPAFLAAGCGVVLPMMAHALYVHRVPSR